MRWRKGQEMLTIANTVTISRAFVALGFLSESTHIRMLVILWASISDIADGWLARKFKQDQGYGALLDPMVDKFFMFFALMVLLIENKMHSYELLALFARDITVAIFGLYLALTGHWNRWQLHAPILGKIFTSLQFIALTALCLQWHPPGLAYLILVGLCLLLFIELMLSIKPIKLKKRKLQKQPRI
jgi:CDP-diacylglycerol--glycerol-3-phosphate 3-phosphatidyltransferase